MAMVQQANDHDVVQRIHTARTKHHHRDAAEAFEKQASACVAACFDRLVPNVEEACRQLQQPVYQQARLWDLYCCDSISCGVYIGESGQSPNVDLIINECQNIGFFTIGDPGPPSSNYCALSSPDTVTTSSPPHTITRTPSTIPGPRTGAITGTLDTSMLFGTPSISASSVRNTSSPVLTSATSTRLTTGAKVAISIFSIIAGVAIIAILLFLIRQRKRRSRSSSPQPPQSPYVNRSYPIPSNGSGTRLITPPPTASSRSVSLTPPAKLSERKFLDPARRTGTPRPPTSPNVANLTSPSWPIDGSAQSGPISRLKAGNMADNDRFPTARAAAAPPSSVYSVSSELSGPTATVHGNKVSSVHSSSASVTGHNMPPPPSVTKFPRKPEAPLSSSEYAAPAAPAPTRALPAPPHNHPNSPTFSPCRPLAAREHFEAVSFDLNQGITRPHRVLRA
ncbi:hypothetical protein F4808DRAFT_154209 [Astrocystis sublimbata]|nr:hypothetical protein F4808DRAFT_154209 [Astrocystis sublimbata]